MEIVASRLKSARVAKRLSQKELAGKIDIDQGHLSRAERGERGLSREHLLRVSKLLDVSMDYLIGVDLGDRPADYALEPSGEERKRLINSYNAPAGLRELALDQSLVDALSIREEEWHTLSSVVLPGDVTKDGYVQLLYTIRAITRA